ncbi:MAG TPA: helix-turn-helix transcriptional regulator [Patescibacteria group bacterium]|nr:helix-turn-helix transcriptional regulator [Patescibacteria group bacterium]
MASKRRLGSSLALNDLQIGRAARALRHRLGLRQVDAAERVGIGHDVVSRVERGRIEGLTIRTLRRLFSAFDAEIVILVRWRGGELDRLLDRRHAMLGDAVVSRLERLGWTVMPEVSYSEYGERGSIDLLAWHAEARTLLVIELKTELPSIEETVRRHDGKTRLAARIALDRFGWQAGAVARLLVLPDERTPRRQVERFANVLGRAYPLRGRAAWTWLASPAGAMSGLIFLTVADQARLRQRPGPVRRIARRDRGR